MAFNQGYHIYKSDKALKETFIHTGEENLLHLKEEWLTERQIDTLNLPFWRLFWSMIDDE